MIGNKSNRPGLNQLKTVLAARQVGCLLLFTTSRLFRNSAALQMFVEQGKNLIDGGVAPAVVAQRLELQPARVTRLYPRWHKEHGLPLPDSRRRMSRLTVGQESVPIYQPIAAEVDRLDHLGWSLQAVADHCDVDRNTVTATMRFLAKQRGERPTMVGTGASGCNSNANGQRTSQRTSAPSRRAVRHLRAVRRLI